MRRKQSQENTGKEAISKKKAATTRRDSPLYLPQLRWINGPGVGELTEMQGKWRGPDHGDDPP